MENIKERKTYILCRYFYTFYTICYKNVGFYKVGKMCHAKIR